MGENFAHDHVGQRQEIALLRGRRGWEADDVILNGELDYFFPAETSQKPLFDLLGTPAADCAVVGRLLGEKTVLNEFVAYAHMAGAAAKDPGDRYADAAEMLQEAEAHAAHAAIVQGLVLGIAEALVHQRDAAPGAAAWKSWPTNAPIVAAIWDWVMG